jgi:hypothetical protein
LRGLDLCRLRKTHHEALKGALERRRIEQPENPAEGIVAGVTVFQFQNPDPKIGLHAREQGNVATGRCAAQRRHQGNEQKFVQIVQRILRTRVGQFRKAIAKLFQSSLPSNQETPLESASNNRATQLQPEHAIPLPACGGGGVRSTTEGGTFPPNGAY